MDTERQASVFSHPASESFSGRRIHLIGMGGSGMRALAGMLLDHGAIVSGSDMAPSAALDRLAEAGAAVAVGQGPGNLPETCDLVVHSAAIHEENPELVAARGSSAEVIKYSQMLGRLMAQRVGIAVAGTHGKSTTSAMVAWALRDAGADPSFVIGASVDQLGGPSGVGAGKHFVAEACEFDRSFLNLSCHYATILNVEEDHLDCYRNLAAIVEAFRAFTARVRPEGVLVANGEDREAMAASSGAACEVQTFGMTDACDWRGSDVTMDRGRASMRVSLRGRDYVRLGMGIPGLHNAYNALAATALLHHAGLSPEQVAASLGRFTGARRRMTRKGEGRGVTVVDDYAHHPTEIQATLRALRDYYAPKRLWCVFQPHQHSRTRFLLKDFARSFAAADEVIVPEIFFVRDSERERDHISAEDLVSQIRLHGGSARHVKGFEQIGRHLQEQLAEGDLVVTMGAGNIWEVADDIVRWLGNDR